MSESNPFSLKQVWGGAKTLFQSGSVKGAGQTAIGGAKTFLDANKDGKTSLWEIGSGVAKWGAPGVVAGTLNQIGSQGQPLPAQPAAQYTPTGNSVLSGYYGLDSFFNQAPQSIGSNFYNTQGYSPSSALSTPAYALPNTSNNSWYTGPGAGSMGPVPAAPQAAQPTPPAPQQIPQTRPVPDKMPVSNWQNAPSMSLADYNALNMKGEAAKLVNDPNSRSVGYTTVAQRSDPLAGHYAHVQKMDMAKYAGDLSPSKSLEDAQFNQEMARKLATLSQ